MVKIDKKFDVKRFLWVVIPFSLVAAFSVYMKPKDPNDQRPNSFPLHNLHIEGQNSTGSVSLNGIPIANFKLGSEKRTSVISLTPWLMNGENKLQISKYKSVQNENQNLKLELEKQPKAGAPILKEITIGAKGPEAANSITTYITAKELPTWSWQKGKTEFHDESEIKAAIKKLHRAFKDKNIKKIREIEKPLFTDMEQLTGREGLERRQYRAEIIIKGETEPLGKLIIMPFADGKVVRVTNKDGLAPIRVYFRYGNGGKVILTGQYWSKIDGQWFVVR